MITYGTGTFLGVMENKYNDKNGNSKVLHQLVILDDMDTIKFFLNDDLYNIILKKGIKKMDTIKLAYNIYSKPTVNSNGYATETVSVVLSGIELFDNKK